MTIMMFNILMKSRFYKKQLKDFQL